VEFIPKHFACHDVQIPHFEDATPRHPDEEEKAQSGQQKTFGSSQEAYHLKLWATFFRSSDDEDAA
jgi:hypothetical protein